MLSRLLLLLTPVLMLPSLAQAAPHAKNHAAKAPAAKDWSRTVTLGSTGGHIIGNPTAKTRIIEYVSYTCPHCAHFVTEGTKPLNQGWVAKGTVAVEVRNLVRDRYDMTAALLARCGGPARFPTLHEALFANFPPWVEKLQAYEKQPSTLPENPQPSAVMTDIAEKTGLFTLVGKYGVKAAQAKLCLADQKTLDTVMAMTKTALGPDQVKGTPSFLINGKLTEAHDWSGLRALLPAPAN
jgi:protein-disulfide isomerase